MPPSVSERLFPHVHGLSVGVDRGETSAGYSNVERLAQRLRRTHLFCIDRVDLDHALVTREVTALCEGLGCGDAVLLEAMQTFWASVDTMGLKGENRRALLVPCIDEAYYKHAGERLDWMRLCETIGVSAHLAHRMERARRDAGHQEATEPFETDIWSPMFDAWCRDRMQGKMHRAQDVKERMGHVLAVVRRYPQLTRLKPEAVVQAIGHVAHDDVLGRSHHPPPAWAVVDLARTIKRVLPQDMNAS